MPLSPFQCSSAWDLILARLQANPDLSSTIFGVEFTDDDFAARMVELVNTRRKELAEQRAQERRERPMTPSQLRQYMRTYVKNQGPAVYSTGWTMAQVQKLSPEQLQEEFDKIQRVVAFTWGLKRDGSPMRSASSKKLKTGDNEVNVEAPSHGVPQEEESSTPSRNVSREEVAAPPHSQDIPAAQVKVPSQKATIEDVDAPSNLASTAQHTASSLKKVGTKKKRLGRKGVHTSQSTIPIKEGDPEAEHKVCIKYAFDADSASDDDTLVNLYAVVDWELLPTGLGSINDFYSYTLVQYFTCLEDPSLGLLEPDFDVNLCCMMTFRQLGTRFTYGGLWIRSILLYVNLIERMLDHQLEICHGKVGNELTTAVQLIAFLKKQISNSKRPKVTGKLDGFQLAIFLNEKWLVQAKGHDLYEACCFCVNASIFLCALQRLSPALIDFLIQESFELVSRCCCSSLGVFNIVTTSRYVVPTGRVKVTAGRYVVPTGRVKVPAGRYVVPTGKDNVIVSVGRAKVIPAGRTILVLLVLMLDDFDRQDVIDLHRLVNERYETTSPEGYDLLLWGDLKTSFEPNEENEIWKNQ
ncbi:hypothetical protein Tco_0522737 [Tanacetum coccineum]